MTPSQWHDDARDRDAGHDEMQIAVYDWLKDQPEETALFRPCDGYERLGVYFEYPFRNGGRIVAWGDVVEIWRLTITEPHGYVHFKQRLVALEIKPKIYSLGAVKRQCIALKDATSLVGDSRATNFRYEGVVWPVVMADDPKLALLRHVQQVVTWDGERLV